MAWGIWKRNQRGLFRKPPDAVLYEETMASGHSMKSWHLKLRGARNCLRLLISNTELWVTPIFPFSALAAFSDLDHRISLSKIQSITLQSSLFSKSLRISYQGSDNVEHKIEIMPRHIDRFIEVLKQRGLRVDAI